MEKRGIWTIIGFVVGCLIMAGLFFLSNNNDIIEEDIESYNIVDRYGCEQIKNNEEYNKCIKFYLDKNPYKLGEELVPIRPVGE